jgi:hypothetical protein
MAPAYFSASNRAQGTANGQGVNVFSVDLFVVNYLFTLRLNSKQEILNFFY